MNPVNVEPLKEGWRWMRLGEVCISTENRDPRTTPDLLFRYVDISGVDNRLKRIIKTHTILWNDAPSRARQIIKANDVLVATTRPNLNAVALVPEELNNEICSTGICVLRPTEVINSLFLFFFVQSKYFIDTISGSGQVRGMLYPAVTDKQVRNVYIPLPPLHEQNRIAAKLQELMEEVERARTACEKKLEAAKALPAAYLREVFESEEAKKWERKRLGEVCEYNSGVWGDEPDSSSLCYPVLRSNNIHNGKIVFDEVAIRKINARYIETKKLKAGDILVTTSSGSRDLLGKSALFVQPSDGKTYLFSNFTMRLCPKNKIIDSIFLYFYLQSPEAKETLKLLQDTTTGLRNMDRKEFLNQMIPFPTLATQQLIAAELKEKMAQVEKLRTTIEKQLETINALPQAVLRKAFRGEL
ncbi:MAG: restriction endonuclease subunit S [Thermodesulfobacteriota bacterium]